jgi:hypothetical protein
MPLDSKISRKGKKWLALAINTGFLIDHEAPVGASPTVAKSGWREKAKNRTIEISYFFISIRHAWSHASSTARYAASMVGGGHGTVSA